MPDALAATATASVSLGAFELVLIALAAVLAGLVNAIAGGGSLISFPVLTAVGLPPVVANVTNTVALLPGYGGAAAAQRSDLLGQRSRLLLLMPAAALGGLLGGMLLLLGGDALFGSMVPWLILLGTVLLALQQRLRRWLLAHPHASRPGRLERLAVGPVVLASIYGGYFGAGLSVILLAVLAVMLTGSLTRLNGLKQALALAVNLAAALLFLGSGQLHATAAVVMATGSAAGGALGGRLASRINPERLRAGVVLLGLLVAAAFFLR
ncbi:conserved domain protein, putative [Cyanobium sp. PCC 7001]|uniref:sulfite exporter TauE/SafE family protein n=1 Tax=Cyanobium sp. PCC 7001 TaxID=180281 RepID=UPI0001804C65|nr:sulfite exporter TauE/SafE family protein [Cyanobium sp. PCC 7001]EDY38332.1 conserved domain protein, putative [Cyanobium sp. PCC 7001]